MRMPPLETRTDPLGRLQKYPKNMSALERNTQVLAPTPHKVLGPGMYHGVKVCWQVSEEKVSQSDPTLSDPVDFTWNSLGQNTRVGSLSLF